MLPAACMVSLFLGDNASYWPIRSARTARCPSQVSIVRAGAFSCLLHRIMLLGYIASRAVNRAAKLVVRREGRMVCRTAARYSHQHQNRGAANPLGDNANPPTFNTHTHMEAADRHVVYRNIGGVDVPSQICST